MNKTAQGDLTTLLLQVRSWWHYRWHAAVFTWIFCLIGWIAVSAAPRKYQATARVRVDTQGILGPLLKGLAVQPDRDQQLALMTRTLLSRPNLERVAASTPELDIGNGTPKERDDAVSQLEKGIKLQSTDRNNLYTFSYSNKSPTAAKAVVASLLDMLVHSVAGEQRRDTSQAQGFLTEQLAEYEKKLSDAETLLSDFKRKNPSFQPGRDYFSRLSDAEALLSTARLELKEAENRRDALQSQVDEENAAEPGAPEVVVDSQLDLRIQELRRNLDTLRLRLTEEHPDVVSARTSLQALEQQQQQAIAAARKAGRPRARPAVQNLEGFQRLQLAKAEAEATVASLKARVSEYRRRHNKIKSAVGKMPEIEAEFAGLNREYEANKKNFQELLTRRDSVQISQDANTQPGLDAFRVVDPPRVPQAPAFPGPPLLASVVLLAGLLGGIGVAFVLTQLRPTFADARTLREATGMTVLGTVSEVWTPSERIAEKRRLYAWVGAYVGLVVAYAGVVAILQMSIRGTS